MNDPLVDAIVYIGGTGTHWTVPVAERVVSDGGYAAEVLARSQEFKAINVPGAANQQGASRIRSFVY